MSRQLRYPKIPTTRDFPLIECIAFEKYDGTYRGKFHGRFADDVRNGKYTVTEGVICKGVFRGEIVMAKIKTNVYQARLKQAFQDEWEQYWE